MTAGAGSEVVPHQRLQILDPRYRVSVAGWGRGGHLGTLDAEGGPLGLGVGRGIGIIQSVLSNYHEIKLEINYKRRMRKFPSV